MKKYIKKIIPAIGAFTLMWLAVDLHGQERSHIDVLSTLPADSRFEDVQLTMAKHFNRFATETEKNRNGYKHWKRWEWFAERHLDPDGQVGAWTRKQEEGLEAIQSMPQLDNANGSWSFAGPGSISNGENFLGRVESVAFHPSDPNIIYVGSGTGGLWRTTNKGTNWTNLTDQLPSLSIASVVVQQSNPSIIYILTGDGDGGPNWGYYVKERSSGVFRSTDGGTTWQRTGLDWNRPDADRYGYKLIQSPTNANLLMAATSEGLWRTTNGGATWTMVITGQVTDVVFRPGNANNVAAVLYASSDLRTSADGGATWTSRTIPNSSGLGTTRSMLAVTPAASGNVYILMGRQGDGNFRGYYRFQWSDNTFTLISNTPNIFNGNANGTGEGGFAWWAIGLAVSPSNSNIHLAGGVIGRRSTDGGATWSAAHPAEMHADLHGYYYNPVDGNAVYAAHDGGLSRSADNGVTWTVVSTGIRVTQYYRISTTPGNTNAVLGGTQDNGHHYRTTNTTIFKHSLTCCDGMDNAINPDNDQIIYMCSQDGGLNRSTNGGDSWTSIKPGDGPWVTPIALHTTTPTTIFFAGDAGIFRSTNSGTSGWVNIGGDGRAAIAQGTSNSARFYAANGTTLRTSGNINDATPTWSTISGTTNWPTGTNIAGTSITGIAVNPHNSGEVWVTFSGYNANTKVYRSTTTGSSWTNMTAGLPNLPVHTIVFQSQGANNGNYQVYVGTDIGVFYRSNTSGGWSFFGNGLPRVMVTDLEFNGTYLYAGTYGRGIWRTLPYATCPTNPNYVATYSDERVFQATGTLTSTSRIVGTVGANVWMKATNYVQLNPGFVAEP
ncbi:MAG TPA: hypothetical protein VK907_08830, partial [Phnomibacter sp.]|nr:hypothetical protein [Phnomibacter sp.]